MFDPRSAAPTPAALARLDELLEQVGALGSHLAGCDDWSDEHREAALVGFDRLAGALAAARGKVLVAHQRAFAAGSGDRDLAAARARTTRNGLGEARREVRQAQTLDALPAVADAVTGGTMPIAHLDALARAAAGASEHAAAALARPDVQQTLVRWSSRQSLKEFTASAARLVASFDPAVLDRSAEAQHRERQLHLSHGPDGTRLTARLDRLAGEALRVALAGMGQAPGDDRTKAQADADALVMLVERAISGMAGVRRRRTGADGRPAPDPEQDAADARVSGVASRPTVSVLVPAETFAEVRAAQRRAEASGELWWAPVEPAALEDGTPIAMSELTRLLCDCEIGRVVLGADSAALDVGRASRLFTPAQRRAVVVRDRACAWNGCEVPAAYCEAHHIRWWERDLGETSVENGVLLCSHHHQVVHQLDLAITRLARLPQEWPPDGSGRSRARPMLAEPVRYTFARRDGGTVNAPPAGVGWDEALIAVA